MKASSEKSSFIKLVEKLAQMDAKAIAKLKAISMASITANIDRKSKYIGDRIVIWDLSRLTFASTGQRFDVSSNEDEARILTNYESIVAEIDCKYMDTPTDGLQSSLNLDLIVWNKELNTEFRTSSEYVKLNKNQYNITSPKQPTVKKKTHNFSMAEMLSTMSVINVIN